MKFRTCHLASHGGIEQCVTTESKVTEWVRFLQYLTNWNNANGACQANGGNLFNKFDGTREQIEFFFQKLGKPSCFRVGLFLENGQWLLWPSYEFVNWDLIVWGTNQPGNEGLLEYKSAGWSWDQINFDYIHDVVDWIDCKTVCSMIWKGTPESKIPKSYPHQEKSNFKERQIWFHVSDLARFHIKSYFHKKKPKTSTMKKIPTFCFVSLSHCEW